MAEVTGLRNNALPYPIYGAPFGIVVPLLDADGDPISPSSADTEISKNGDTAADCTNEIVEIGSMTGVGYLLLTGTELTTDVASIQFKSTGAKTTIAVLYPRKLVTVRSGTSAGGSGSTITLDSGASAVDDYYNGMVCIATIDSVVEVRVIGDYVGSTKVATIEGPNWVTASPDSDDTFIIKLTEGARIGGADNLAWLGTTIPSPDTAGYPKVTVKAGTGTGELDITSGVVKANLAQILGTALTETAGLIAAGFKKFFNVATPTGTVNSLPDAVPDASGGLPVTGTRLTSIPWNAAWDAEVQSEATDALNAYDPPTKAELDSAVSPLATASALATVDSVADAIQAKTDNLPSDPADQSLIIAATNAIISDTEDIQARLPAALTGDGNMKSDVLRINGSSKAAAGIAAGGEAIVPGACIAGSSATSINTGLTEATNNHFNGRIISFRSGALDGQSSDIIDYDGATKVLTVTALTEAPADGDTFVIS